MNPFILWRPAAAAAGFLAAAGCIGAPFSYSSDRCLGGYNQCRNQCPAVEFGEAQAACYDRCLARQQQCHSVGDDGAGSSMAQDGLIGDTRDRAAKEADFQRWKAKRARERAESSDPAEDDAALEKAPDQ